MASSILCRDLQNVMLLSSKRESIWQARIGCHGNSLNWRCRKTENPKRFWHCRSRVNHLNTCPFTRFQFDRTLCYAIEHIWILKPSCHATLNGGVESCHTGKYYSLFKIALFSLQSPSSVGDEGFVDPQLKGVVARSNRTERKIKQRLGTG